MITIDTATGYSVNGDIVARRAADGLVLAVSQQAGVIPGDLPIYCVYLCREYQRHVGRKHETRYEWLSFRDGGRSFATLDEATAYANSVAEA